MSKFKVGDTVRRTTPPGSRWVEFIQRHPGPDYLVTAVSGYQIQVNAAPGWWFAGNFKLVQRPGETINDAGYAQLDQTFIDILRQLPTKRDRDAMALAMYGGYGGTVTGRMTSPNPFPQQLPKENPVALTTPEITQALRAYDKANERAAVAVTVQSEASEALRQARLEAERKLSYYQRLCEATRQLLDAIHSPAPSGYAAIAPFADELQPLAAEFGATLVVVNARAYIKKD